MWDDYTKEIIKAVDYSYIADNKWIYPNEKADKEFFLNLVQQYQADLLDETDAELFSYEDSLQVIRIRKISEAVLKYYPDNTEALNNLGVSYYLCLDYPKALEIFLKAEKLNPKDAVIKFNIANLYAKTGDKPRAKQYYKTLTDNFTGEVAQKAAELIKELE